MKVHSLSLWERVGVRGYGPCLKGLRPLTRPTSACASPADLSPPGRGEVRRYFLTSGQSLCESGLAASSGAIVAISL